ncbi:tetratricopeptide repeat protein [candidate division WOR-3 bacterium]|nr:tetratricopeptide repeat protein [candidate division WOR-3 bacterium]
MKTSRRFCSLLFVDIAGFSAIAENNDPEKVKKILEIVFCKADEIAKKFGGFLYQTVGDQIVFVFGAPLSLENQDERAVLSAHEIRESSASLSESAGVQISFHIGIHSGDLLCGEIDVNGKSSLSIVGDAINVASRLQQICPKNQIYISQKIRKNVSHLFNTRFIESVRFKGKKNVVDVHRLLSQKTRRRSRRGIKWANIPFVGREKEFLSVINFLNKKDNLSNILLVTGEPGVGKTRFVEELKRKVWKGSETLKARSIPYGADSFSGVKSFMESLLPELSIKDISRKDLVKFKNFLKKSGISYHNLAADTFIDFFAGKFSIDSEKPKIRFLLKILVDLSKLSIERSGKKRVVFIFEDLHWAKKPLLDLIEALAKDLPPKKALIVLVSRSNDSGGILSEYIEKFSKFSRLHQIPLLPLQKFESQNLVSFILNIEKIPPDLRTKILDHCQGNPLYLEEITKMLIDRKILWQDKNVWTGKATEDFIVPQTVGEIIMSRFDILGDQTKNFLEAASVAGYTFRKEMVLKVKGISGKKAVDESAEKNFISETSPGEYSFSHIMIRDAIYSSITNEQKIQLHGEIFKYLENSRSKDMSFAQSMAHHAQMSQNHGKAFKYFLLSSQYDEKRYSFHHAIDCLEKCEKIISSGIFSPSKKLMFDYLMTAGRIYGFCGNHKKSLIFLGKINSLSLDSQDKALFYLEISAQFLRTSRYREALTYVEKGLSLAQKIQKSLVFRLLLNKADALYFLGDINDSHIILDRANKYLLNKNNSSSLSYRGKLADILNEKGHPEKALKIRLEIEKKAAKLNLLSLLSTNYNNIGVIYDNMGKPYKALAAYEKANEIDRKTGYSLGEAITSYNIASHFAEFGNNQEALKWLECYHRLNLKIDNLLGEGYYNLGLSEVKYNKDKISSSIGCLEKALKVFSSLKSKNMEFYVLELILLHCAENHFSKTFEPYFGDFNGMFSKMKNKSSEDFNISHKIVSAIVYKRLGENRKFEAVKKQLLRYISSSKTLPEEGHELNALLSVFSDSKSVLDKIRTKCSSWMGNYCRSFKTEHELARFKRRRLVRKILDKINTLEN